MRATRIRIAPKNPQAHNLMGLVLTEANRPLIGEYHYRKVLALSDAEEPITLGQPRVEFEKPGPHGRGARAV
jgi:hypothetical protein